MKMRQYTMLSGKTQTTVWLTDDKRLRSGTTISLKDDPRRWVIVRKGDAARERDSINQTWRVGGL